MATKTKPEDFVTYHEGYADIQLSRPLNIGGAKLAALRMREPTVADQLVLDKMSGSDAEKEIALMSNLCEQAPQDFQVLPLRDYRRVQVAFKGFQD